MQQPLELTDDQMKGLGLVHIAIGDRVENLMMNSGTFENLSGRYNLSIVGANIYNTQIINIINIIHWSMGGLNYTIEYAVDYVKANNYSEHMWRSVLDVHPRRLVYLQVIRAEDGSLTTTSGVDFPLIKQVELRNVINTSGGKKRKSKSNRTKKPKRKRRRTRSKMSKRV